MAAKEKKIEQVLRPLVESLKAGLAQNLIALVLFGSRARGETRKVSDWDLFLLARSLPTSPMKRYSYLRGLSTEPLEGYLSAELYGELRSAFDRVGQMLTRLSQALGGEPRARETSTRQT